MAGELERFGGVRRIFLTKQQRILELADLEAPPRNLRFIEAVERSDLRTLDERQTQSKPMTTSSGSLG